MGEYLEYRVEAWDGEGRTLHHADLPDYPTVTLAIQAATSLLDGAAFGGHEASAVVLRLPARDVVWSGRCRRVADLPSPN